MQNLRIITVENSGKRCVNSCEVVSSTFPNDTNEDIHLVALDNVPADFWEDMFKYHIVNGVLLVNDTPPQVMRITTPSSSFKKTMTFLWDAMQ